MNKNKKQSLAVWLIYAFLIASCSQEPAQEQAPPELSASEVKQINEEMPALSDTPDIANNESSATTVENDPKELASAPVDTPAKPAHDSPKLNAAQQDIAKALVQESAAKTDIARDRDIAAEITRICTQIGNKLGSVSVDECLSVQFDSHRFYSASGSPLLEKEFSSDEDIAGAKRILFLGGVHGDEYSSISVTFKWLATLKKHHSGRFHWLFLPLVNPDGLLQKKSTRTNGNKIDLNRNFSVIGDGPTPIEHWQQKAFMKPRYFPGNTPESESETLAIKKLLDDFDPDVIVSVHAPHGVLDYDGAERTDTAPQQLGPLKLELLGTYPGSLGHYAWLKRGIPVITIELEYAGIMPSNRDIRQIWSDLVTWINHKLPKREFAQNDDV